MEIDFDHEKLAVSREWLLDEASDLIYVADLYQYDLLYMNNHLKELLKLQDDVYKGKKCYQVLYNADAPCPFCTNHLLNREQFYHWECYHPLLQQTLLLKDRVVDWYGRPARIEFGYDVTRLDKRSKFLEKKLEIYKTIVACYPKLDQPEALKFEVEKILSMLGQLYDADRTFLLRNEIKSDIVMIQSLWLKEGVAVPQILEHEWTALLIAFGETIEDASFEMNDRTQLDSAQDLLFPIYVRNQIYCQRVVPYWVNGERKGYICLDNPRSFTDDLDVLKSFGDCIAALHHAMW